MLEIKPIEDKKTQKEYCVLCGVSYKADDMAYGASEGGKLLGVCQFRIGNGTGYIHDLICADGVDDFEALFLMGRQTLNFIDLCGVHKAEFCGEESRLTKAIGFKKDGGKLTMDLEGFFIEPCSHKK